MQGINDSILDVLSYIYIFIVPILFLLFFWFTFKLFIYIFTKFSDVIIKFIFPSLFLIPSISILMLTYGSWDFKILLIAFIFGGFALLFLIPNTYTLIKKLRLKKVGKVIKCKVIAVEKSNITIQSKEMYNVIVEIFNPKTIKPFLGKSEIITIENAPTIGESVDVYVHPENYEIYWIDIKAFKIYEDKFV